MGDLSLYKVRSVGLYQLMSQAATMAAQQQGLTNNAYGR